MLAIVSFGEKSLWNAFAYGKKLQNVRSCFTNERAIVYMALVIMQNNVLLATAILITLCK